ncbi:hypothetical protein PHLCEN_2v4595 [Hermanssonia centrifuga]|uniref:Uncharacterized protein n=1 Tax=Hermanssonia centrifuga TaxID=98765 RepID=A0A2R6PNV8_9APHY|nr:hypothetical protein PHLCEN_2v4595 [Hermanssonia centrifuga]
MIGGGTEVEDEARWTEPMDDREAKDEAEAIASGLIEALGLSRSLAYGVEG